MKDYNLLLEPRDVLLPLLDDLRLKIRLPVPGNLQVDLPELRFEGLGREPVTGVVGGLGLLVVFFVTQMVGQLALEESLDDLLANVPHEGVKIVQGLDALLLKQFFQLILV